MPRNPHTTRSFITKDGAGNILDVTETPCPKHHSSEFEQLVSSLIKEHGHTDFPCGHTGYLDLKAKGVSKKSVWAGRESGKRAAIGLRLKFHKNGKFRGNVVVHIHRRYDDGGPIVAAEPPGSKWTTPYIVAWKDDEMSRVTRKINAILHGATITGSRWSDKDCAESRPHVSYSLA